MTITKVLTPVAFVALTALAGAPVDAAQYRGGGRSRGAVISRGYSGYRGVVRGGRIYGGGVRVVRPFYRPYYSFRPRVSLGFGLWMGYPVPYPYYYDVPYGYAYRSVDPYYDPAPSYGYSQPYAVPEQPSGYRAPDYPASNYPDRQSAPAIGAQRGDQQSSGGISFEITPENAEVFVDGTYMGTVGEFGAREEPLGLNVGRHRVEIRAAGYRTMTFEADVRPGEVIPYQGTLQRN